MAKSARPRANGFGIAPGFLIRMSGIAGIFHPDVPKPVDPARVEAMTRAIVHRGPDGSGVWTAPGIGLGHRHLSVLAGSDAAAQPTISADGRIALSLDGEIHNLREIGSDLEACGGHKFEAGNEVELVIAAWRQWGPDCVARFDGEFAFAVHDADHNALFLARDRLGVKPLLHARLSDGALIFASELKGLLAHPRLRRSISPQAVEDYFALGFVPDDNCFVEAVSKLPAGHFLHVRRSRPVPEPTAYWDVDFSRTDRRPVRRLEAELVHRLAAAVGSRMTADVSLGAFLSGGIASSAVVGFMAESSRTAVETCSIDYGDPEVDESHFAELAAQHFVTRHRTGRVAGPDAALIGRIAEAFDEPFGDPAAVGAFQLSSLAAENTRIVFSGEGADEAFAGHEYYPRLRAEDRIRRLLPGPLRGAVGAVGNLLPELEAWPKAAAAKSSLQALGLVPGEAFAVMLSATPRSIRSAIFSEAFRTRLQGHRAEDRFIRAFEKAPATDTISRTQYADLKIFLPGRILTRLDRSTMAAGIQARLPWLDHHLIEFVGRIPVQLRLRGKSGKWLVKRSLKGRLPKEILSRGKFEPIVPTTEWLRTPLAGQLGGIGQSSALSELGWFDRGAITRLVEDHRRGRADHGRLLWQLLMLEASLQHVTGFGSVKPVDRQPRQNKVRRAGR